MRVRVRSGLGQRGGGSFFLPGIGGCGAVTPDAAVSVVAVAVAVAVAALGYDQSKVTIRVRVLSDLGYDHS